MHNMLIGYNESAKDATPLPILTNNPNCEGVRAMAKKTLSQPRPVCKLPWCNNPVYGRMDICNMHYQQKTRYGGIRRRTIKDLNEIICDGDICRIVLTDLKGKPKSEVIIDREDKPMIEGYRWGLSGNGYIRNNSIGYLHDFVLNYKSSPKYPVDHEDRNQLNCRKSNLRICKQSQNGINSPLPKNNTSGYKGVCFSKAAKKWMARIKVNYKGIYLGVFDDPKDAAAAYNEAAKKYFGDFAWLNPI